MDLYTRRQLTLLLVIVIVAAAGLGIDRWRRAHPDLAERLETLDRAPSPSRPERAVRSKSERRPTTGPAPIDLNRASREDLQRLPGVGPGLAGRIVDARQRHGSFSSIDDLRRVRGIGAKTLAQVRPLLAIGPAP